MPSSFKDIFLLSKGSGVKPFSPSLAWIVQWRMTTDTHTPWTSHTSQNEPCHSPQDCFLSCWDMRFLNQILLGMKMPPQCSIILEKWQHVRQQMSNLIEMWPHHCQHFCLSLADHNQRKTEHYHVSDSMLIVSGCVLPFIASVNVPFLSVLSGYFCLICPSFLISFPPSPSLSIPPFIFFGVFLSSSACLPPAADVWQVFPGIVRDCGCQPCFLRTDGGSLPVWRGAQCCSDLGYLSAGSGLPGSKV